MEAIIELIQKSNFATLRKKKMDSEQERPYVNSRELNNISGNYKEYIYVLFYLGLIIIDEDYSHVGINPYVDPNPKSYEFSAIYRQKLFYQKTKGINRGEVMMDYNNIYTSIYLDNNEFNRLNRFYSFLSFDVDTIINDINDVFDKGIRGGITTKNREKLKPYFLRYNSFIFSTYALGERDFHFSRSLTNHRHYGPLTNYPKKLRKHFTLAGKKIVSVDLSNAQPYFSLLLFNKDFWLGEDCSDPLPINIDTIGMKFCFRDTIYNYIDENNFPCFESYRDLVLKNELYDYLIDPEHDNYDKARNEAKKNLYGIIFSQAESKYKVKSQSNRGRFMTKFPDVYDLLKFIKSEENQNQPVILNTTTGKVQQSHSLLPIMLQRIEAYIFIDVIAAYILKHHPEIPIIPIHDCLATIEEQAATVEMIITEQIYKHTAYNPILKTEPW